MCLTAILLLLPLVWNIPVFSDNRAPTITEKAAEQCRQKMEKIKDFAEREESDAELSTRITEEEINAYLSRNLNTKYQACLKSLRLTFKKDFLEGLASVDFDCIQETSQETSPTFVWRLFSGTHVINGRGKVVSGESRGMVQIEQIWFDDSRLPNFLVEEAVELLCKAQNSSFNPMQSSPLPYAIKRIAVHPGYVMIYQ